MNVLALMKMKTKIKETVNNQFRVLWSDNEGLRGGYEDFNSKALAENYIKRLQYEKQI